MKTNVSNPNPASSAESPPKSRVFLVDDHPITRQGLVALINREPNLVVCGEADSAPVAIDLIQKLTPDIALVDVTLKTTSGIEISTGRRCAFSSARMRRFSRISAE